MRYAMDGSGFTILNETTCMPGSSWSKGTGCPLTLGMLSFGNMGRVTSLGRMPTVQFGHTWLRDEFCGCFIRVRGHAGVMCHLMFGILALILSK